MTSGAVVRRWADGWWAIGHLGMDLLLATPYLVLVSVVLTGLAHLPVALVGALLLWPGLWLAERAGALERHRIRQATGVRIQAPPRRPRARGFGAWVRDLFHPTPWRATAHLFLASLWGTAGACLVLALLGFGVGTLTLPLYARGLPQGRFPLAWWGSAPGAGGLAGLVVAGVLAVLAAPVLAGVWVRVEVALARALLGPSRREVESTLHARVDTLTSTRDAVVDSVQDDGVGGARLDAPGSGLRGLRDRARPAPRVILAEDSVLLREGLVRLLTETGFEVRAACPDAESFLRAVAADPPDLVVVDVRMPPTFTDEGLRAALTVRAQFPQVAVLVLSQYVEERYATDLVADRSGAVGYLLKDRVGDGAVEKHIAGIFTKLDLPPTPHDHRRVLAVLRGLGHDTPRGAR